MKTAWIHFRRLVASIMLVAVLSFVVHGGAMAGLHPHGPGSAECATPGASGHVHRVADTAHAVDEHDGATAHPHAAASHSHRDSTNDSASHDHQAGETCCASVCWAALTVPSPDLVSALVGVAALRLGAPQDRAGTHPDGLKRPPRTLDIA